jgi:hypothetical protein
LFWGKKKMERRRVKGRFVREGLDGSGVAESEGEKVAVGAPQPRHCRTFTRARVAEALPEIVMRFVEEAKKGSIPHARMLTNLGGLDKGEAPQVKKRRGKSTVGRLLETLSREPKI